jgi:hypothetical protein
VHRAHHRRRELVPHRQDELQIGHRLLGLLGPLPVRGEAGEGEPAEVLRQAQVGRGGGVQPGQRRRQVIARARAEEPGQRLQQRLVTTVTRSAPGQRAAILSASVARSRVVGSVIAMVLSFLCGGSAVPAAASGSVGGRHGSLRRLR